MRGIAVDSLNSTSCPSISIFLTMLISLGFHIAARQWSRLDGQRFRLHLPALLIGLALDLGAARGTVIQYMAYRADVVVKLDYKLRFNTTEDECKFVLDLENTKCNKKIRFFGITFIDFTQSFHAFFYGQNENNIGINMHEIISEAVNDIIAKSEIPQEEIAFDIYGILGDRI